MSPRRVLGIDPGTRVTGWGVVEPAGPRCRLVAAGIIRCGDKRPLAERLRRLSLGLRTVIATHGPTAVAIEDLFHAKHARSALILGHARGVAMLAAADAELDIATYAPALVKKSVTGRGGAPKEQVARLVGAMLGMRTLPETDATDALAIALTHVQASRSTARLATVPSR